MGKYKSYGTLSETTHEAGVVQQCTEAQAGVVQDGLIQMRLLLLKLCTILRNMYNLTRDYNLHPPAQVDANTVKYISA